MPSGGLTSFGISLEVPASSSIPYEGVLTIIDSDSVYLPTSKNVKIGRDVGAVYDIDTLILQLPSGKGCLDSQEMDSCLQNSQITVLGQFSVKVLDSALGDIVKGAVVDLGERSEAGEIITVQTITTDVTGSASFTNVKTGTYVLSTRAAGFIDKRLEWVYQGVVA